jgi:SAM-dependent methyltransferase
VDQKSRKEKAADFLARTRGLFSCPICRKGMAADISGLFCEAGHRFDISRKGTVCLDRYYGNRSTQYGAKLFESRRRIWEGGFFGPLTGRLVEELRRTGGLLADAGCGEGSLAAALHRELEGDVLGFDLSSEGISAASRFTDGGLLFCSADLSNLPLRGAAVSAVVNMLSPAAYEEFRRVLRPGGIMLKVVPTGEHLKELRSADAHTRAGEESVGLFLRHFPQATTEELTYTLPCTRDQWADISVMSPLSWAGHIAPFSEKITFSFLLLFGWIS